MAAKPCFNLVVFDSSGKPVARLQETAASEKRILDTLKEGYGQPPKKAVITTVLSLNIDDVFAAASKARVGDDKFSKQVSKLAAEAMRKLAKQPQQQRALQEALSAWKKLGPGASAEAVHEALSKVGQSLINPKLRYRLLQENGKSMHRLATEELRKLIGKTPELKNFELIDDKALRTVVEAMPASKNKDEALKWLSKDVDDFAKAAGDRSKHPYAGSKLGDLRLDLLLKGPDGKIHGAWDITSYDFERGVKGVLKRIDKELDELSAAAKAGKSGKGPALSPQAQKRLAELQELKQTISTKSGDDVLEALVEHDASLLLSEAKYNHAERLELVQRFLAYLHITESPMRAAEVFYQQLDIWR